MHSPQSQLRTRREMQIAHTEHEAAATSVHSYLSLYQHGRYKLKRFAHVIYESNIEEPFEEGAR